MSHSKEIFLGVVVSGILAGAAAQLLTSKKRQHSKRDLFSRCVDCKDKLAGFVDEAQHRAKSLKGQAGGNISEWAEKAGDVLDFVTDEIDFFIAPEHEELRKGLIAGGLCGSLVGIGTALFCKARLSCKKEAAAKQKISTQVVDWANVVKEVLAAKDERKNPFLNGGSFTEFKKKDTFNDVLDLTVAGVQLWNRLKKRR